MPDLHLPPPDTLMRELQGASEAAKFVRALRKDYPLLYLDTVRAVRSGDCCRDDRLPAQVVERVISFTGREHTDVHVMFRLAERMLAEYPEAYRLDSPRH